MVGTIIHTSKRGQTTESFEGKGSISHV